MVRKTISTSQNDAYKWKTQQQHQNLIDDFAKFYNIFWSHKELFCIGWGIWMQFWKGWGGKFEQTNLKKFNAHEPVGVGEGMLQFQIDLPIT